LTSSWGPYGDVLRRRWPLIAAVLLLDVLVSGYLFVKSYRQVGYQGCVTLFVADSSAPSLISAPQSALESTGQLLAGETAANFFADDELDVARSSLVASYVSSHLPGGLPSSTTADLTGAVSGSRLDRTVNLCVSNPSAATALAAAHELGKAMSTQRAAFVGKGLAARTFVKVISPATVSRAPASNHLLNLALRLILGLVVAVGLALLWEAVDPRRPVPQEARSSAAQ
jgi:capsular polysaccharide biosynthesis protein